MSLSSLKKKLPRLLLLPALWIVLVLLFAGQSIIATDTEWDDALARAAGFWLPWLALLPATAWLAARFPLERPHLLRAVIIHLAACAAAVLACQFYTPTRQETPRPPREPEGMRRPGPPHQEGQPPREERRGPPSGRNFRPQVFRAALDVLVFTGVLSLTHALTFLRRSRQREVRSLELEASLATARLDTLRLQINPHFLFNTLNAISSLIHTRPDTADEMTGSLSELLRASLHGSGAHEVTLREELETLRLFTDIERTRFGERVAFNEDIAPDTLTVAVPSLMLQPMVENAIRHGLEPRTQNGTVTVSAHREDGQLVLRVSDDGVGYAEKESATHDGPGGIGLTNTRDRLRALYGDAQSLTIAPGAAGGTVVTIRIPFRTA